MPTTRSNCCARVAPQAKHAATEQGGAEAEINTSSVVVEGHTPEQIGKEVGCGGEAAGLTKTRTAQIAAEVTQAVNMPVADAGVAAGTAIVMEGGELTDTVAAAAHVVDQQMDSPCDARRG